jgi:hypothetical protein
MIYRAELLGEQTPSLPADLSSVVVFRQSSFTAP